jgi:hypothetical protein
VDYFECDYFDQTYFDTPDCGEPVAPVGHHAVGRPVRLLAPDDEADELLAII